MSYVSGLCVQWLFIFAQALLFIRQRDMVHPECESSFPFPLLPLPSLFLFFQQLQSSAAFFFFFRFSASILCGYHDHQQNPAGSSLLVYKHLRSRACYIAANQAGTLNCHAGVKVPTYSFYCNKVMCLCLFI